MRIADYTIEIHNMSGPYRSFAFTGQRREARHVGRKACAKKDGKRIEGFKIHFHRYVK